MPFTIRMGKPEMEALWLDLSGRQQKGRLDITVLAIEPHPEDIKRGAYERIKLSDVPVPKDKIGGKG